ncbi:hypothetical protein LTR09_011428 [Extremus antarcticus]|uniref:Uncharacterized protein n=1 Tax=Extremus antarcticus TaxID=702011 RepID=A0AAJ0DCD5_9PEZI|nr:hypothetical protein LTR09_011428 [Extremus antarcticus]
MLGDRYKAFNSRRKKWQQTAAVESRSSELLDTDIGSGSNSSSNDEVATNRPKGAWASQEEYLNADYELLREDTIRPLREAVQY